MSQNDAIISVNQESNNITISDLREDEVVIDYSGDVDFTELVSELTRCLDKDEQVNFSISKDYDDEKLVVIMETIEDILEKFNEVIIQDLDTDLKVQISESSDIDDLDDDLPF